MNTVQLSADNYSVFVKCKKHLWKVLPIIFQLPGGYYDDIKTSHDDK